MESPEDTSNNFSTKSRTETPQEDTIDVRKESEKEDSTSPSSGKMEKKEAEEIFVNPSTLVPFTGDSLPYDLSSLTWDSTRRKNTQNCYCYCSKPRTRWSLMLNCVTCGQWFHIECLTHKLSAVPLLGDWCYNFTCAICSTDHTEHCELVQKNWTDIVRIAIWNLIQQERKKGSLKRFFQYKDELCSFIDKNWAVLCPGKTRTKTWENTIGSSLSTKPYFFESGSEQIGAPGYWGLREEIDPSLVKDSKVSTSAVKPKKKQSKKKRGADDAFGTEEVKHNKLRRAKPVVVPIFLPKTFYDPRRYGYTEQCLAKENSAPQIKILADRLTALNEMGYRMARAAIGVREGTWFYEIECLSHSGNVRLGWSTEKGDVQAPVGYDRYSYSYRDKEGTKFHVSRGLPYGQPYGSGDTIGFYISLPKVEKSLESTQPPAESKPIDTSKKTEEELKPIVGSQIIFFKNGESQGIAFNDIFDGTYYPAASLYMGGTVKFNFGPTFKYPPPLKYSPLCNALPPSEPLPPDEVKQDDVLSLENTETKPIENSTSNTSESTTTIQEEEEGEEEKTKD